MGEVIELALVQAKVQPKEPKRCSDYDTDCAGVMCHESCYHGFGLLDKADGYCPYLGVNYDH